MLCVSTCLLTLQSWNEYMDTFSDRHLIALFFKSSVNDMMILRNENMLVTQQTFTKKVMHSLSKEQSVSG